jgi:hypothetical protein
MDDQEHDRTDMLVLPISVLLLSCLEAYVWRGAEHWTVLTFLGCGWVALAALSAEVIAAVALHSDVLQDVISTHQFEAVTSLDCSGTNATVLRLCALGRETDLFEAASWVAWILAATSVVRAACLFNRTVAEAAKAAAARERVTLPPEWTSVSDSAGVDFVDVPDKCRFFEDKIKDSAKVTADTTAAHSMDRLRVHRVVRVENAPLFESYQRERAKVCRRLDTTRAAGNTVSRLEEHAPEWLAVKAGFPAVVDSNSNELLLWHGTSASIDITHPDGTTRCQDTWEILARHGFDERVGGDSNGGLYGKGSYFADAASKANQYATEPICQRPLNAKGHHCMLSCRVTMGDPYMTPSTLSGDRRPPDNPATPGLPYDSVFAKEGFTDNGRGPGSQFHNEYVVFSNAQVYPEYVIWYTRTD